MFAMVPLGRQLEVRKIKLVVYEVSHLRSANKFLFAAGFKFASSDPV